LIFIIYLPYMVLAVLTCAFIILLLYMNERKGLIAPLWLSINKIVFASSLCWVYQFNTSKVIALVQRNCFECIKIDYIRLHKSWEIRINISKWNNFSRTNWKNIYIYKLKENPKDHEELIYLQENYYDSKNYYLKYF
jgi:hypothetical protein